MVWMLYRRRRPRPPLPPWEVRSDCPPNETNRLGRGGFGAVHRVTCNNGKVAAVKVIDIVDGEALPVFR